ncbi:hypothetical protein [Sphingomonas abietis]|uniref:Uncharacterized protein n=1 Tax=Sphingomonas abietis TaxID=3012344 RepID=A0ABY7NKG5_9SPHN|nr:hypothetical protein [Sphingomonas abietis]WBO21979.1 hypothetical protein PBT88_17725 [Sphingomonas abietis]
MATLSDWQQLCDYVVTIKGATFYVNRVRGLIRKISASVAS